MNRIIISAVMLSAVLLGGGCGRKEAEIQEPGWIIASEAKLISEMQPQDVIVSVNGRRLTREKYEQMLKNTERAYRMIKPDVAAGMLQNYMKARQSALIVEFINRQFILSEAQKRKLNPLPELQAQTEAHYREQARKQGRSLSELAAVMGDTPKEFEIRMKEDALIKTVIKVEFGDTLEVTEKDIQNEKERVERYNLRCDATNAIVKATGEWIVKELRAGADFAAMAIEYSETEDDQDGLWGDFIRVEIEDAQVRNAAFTLPVGAVSDPLDTDSGLIIIKVLERTGLDALGAEQEATVKLGRILLRLGDYLVCPEGEALRRKIAQEKSKHYQLPFLKKIRDVSRVEFPNGTNLWSAARGSAMPVLPAR